MVLAKIFLSYLLYPKYVLTLHIIVWEIIKYYYDMNISYNWLKEYVDFDLTPDEVRPH